MAFNQIDPTTSEFMEFVQEFRDESDRAAVILGAARIDLFLYNVIQHALHPSTSRSDELLDGDSPLSTFGARIEIAFRLGLIDANLTRALHQIRKIRNSFAHESIGISLNSGAHRDRVRELVVGIKSYSIFDKFLDLIKRQHQDASAEFRAAVALISLRLQGLCEVIRTIEPNISATLIHEEWEKKENKSDPSVKPETKGK
jgi:DNA-binding MltR family transcriptional regulator